MNFLKSLFSWRPNRGGIAWITPRLAQSGARAAGDTAALASRGIGSILDLRGEDEHDHQELARHGIRYLRLPTRDFTAPSLEHFETGTRWVLDEMAQDRAVLIHCRAGLGRSVVMTAAVLVRMGYDLPEALQLVRQKRPDAIPTEEQLQALREFTIQCQGDRKGAFKEGDLDHER